MKKNLHDIIHRTQNGFHNRLCLIRKKMDKRPKLDKNIQIENFIDFYWLKDKLVEFSRKEGLNKQGGKIELANRI